MRQNEVPRKNGKRSKVRSGDMLALICRFASLSDLTFAAPRAREFAKPASEHKLHWNLIFTSRPLIAIFAKRLAAIGRELQLDH
jgi:hypothetical protein